LMWLSTTTGCRWCEPRLSYQEDMWCVKPAWREETNALNRWSMCWWS
jgi:hypothetical protein